jgi:DNA polymerase (family 10)
MENREYAHLLSETADLMEIAGEDGFRIRSYRNGATAIEGHPERIEDILRDSGRNVTDIPGIGKGLSLVLQEILNRGSFERRDELLSRYPPTALELLRIQGLGPKSIGLIWNHFRVSTIDGLERLCREQKLQTLPRMGAKLEEKVLRSIAQYRQRAGRFLLSFAAATSREITETLLNVPGVTKITPAGSLRRCKETIGDLDLLITGPEATNALDVFTSMPRQGRK